MQVGDKVVYIGVKDKGRSSYTLGYVTIGNVYEITYTSPKYSPLTGFIHYCEYWIFIINDNLESVHYYPEDFKLLSEYRNELIDDICK